jgi:hypothetical protein
MEESMAWGQRRFFKVDAHPVNGGAKNMAAMPSLFNHSMERLF